MHRILRGPLAGVLLVLAGQLLPPTPATAQIYLWNGGTGTGPHSWNTNGNWSIAGFPNASGVTASLLADWSAAPTINLNQAITVGRLFIDDTGGSGDVGVSVSANGGSLTFNNGASTALLETFGDASLNLINSGVTLTSNLNATITSNLAITGVVSGGGGLNKLGTGILVLTNTNTYSGGTTVSAGTLQIGGGGTNGSIEGNVSVAADAFVAFRRSNTATYGGIISGAGGLLQADSGTTVLTGTNTYTGQTLVQGGILAIGPGGSLASQSIVVTTGATMRFTHDSNMTYAGVISGGGALLVGSSGTTTLTGASTYAGGTTLDDGTLRIGNGGTTGSIVGNVNMNGGDLSFNRSDTVTFAGVISGTGSGRVIKDGTGTLILTATNTYTGNTRIDAGTLQFGNGGTSGSATNSNIINNSALAFNRSDTLTYSGVVSNSGSLTQAGTGTLILTGTNTYSGGTTISGGTLQIGSGGANGSITGDVLNNSALVVNRQGTLTLAGAISGTGGLTKQGSGTLILTGANTYSGGTTINNGTLQIGAGGTSGSITGDIGSTGGGVVFNRSDALTYAGAISGSASFLKDGAGTLILTGDSTHTGGSLVFAGTLQLGAGGTTGSIAGDIGNFGALIVNRSNTYDLTSVISQNGTLTKQGAGTLRLGGANTYTGTTTVSGGVLTIGTGGATGSIVSNVTNNSTLIFNRTTDYTYAGDISGSGSIFKVNTNTLTLTGTNTYTGTTHLEGGTLVFSSLGNLGSGGTIRFGGGTLQWAAGNGADISTRTVFIDAGGATFDTNGNNVTLTNAIGNGGSGSLTKTGNAFLTLVGNNTYTGTTTISAGQMQLGVGGSTGSVAGDIVNNSTLIFFRSDSVTYAGTISGTGFVQQSGPGSLTFTGDNTYSGQTVLANSSTLQFGNGGTTGSVAGNINVSTGDLVFNRSNDLTYGGVVSGTSFGSVTKQGAGTLTATGAWTFTGDTTISAGTLRIGNGGSTGSLAGNIVNNAALVFNRSDGFFFASVISGTGSVTKQGAGAMIFTADQTYAGGTTISGGNLQVGFGGTTGSLVGNVLNNSQLSFSRSDNYTFAGVISGSGTVYQAGNGTLILTGDSTFAGSAVINAGTLQIGNGGTTGSVTGDIGNNAALIFNRSNALTYAGLINGAGTVTKAGTGTLTLTGANTYTGGTVLSAGTLSLGSSGALGTTGGLSFFGGTLQFTAANTTDYSARFSSAAGQIYRLDTNGQVVIAASDLIGGNNLVKSGSNTLNLTGNNVFGSVSLAAGTLALGSAGALGSTGTISFDNGVLRYSAANATDYSARFSTAAGQEFKINTNGQAVTFASPLASSGGTLVKSGAGTLTLNGASTYTGATTVSAGTLMANNGTGSATGSGAVSVQSGATLGGDGSISGAVTVNSGGFLAPGSSPGDLAVGSVIFSAGATFLVELGGLTPGTQYDVLNVTGAANLSGTLDVTLFGGYVPNVGDMFTVINAGSRSGAFASLNGHGIGYDVAYGTNNVVLTVTAVPEPVTLALFGLGSVAASGTWWWRRQRQQAEVELDEVPDVTMDQPPTSELS